LLIESTMLLLNQRTQERKAWRSTTIQPWKTANHFLPYVPQPFRAVDTGGTSLCSSSALPLTLAAVAPASGVSFLKLLMAFVAGGLFFSTAIAAVTACYAVGLENVERSWDILKIVLRDVWLTFTVGLKGAKMALRRDGSWKWRDAWKVFKEKLGETRRKAAEGVEAIRLQGNLYAAAVGAPGLIPLQYVVDRLLPYSIASQLEDSLRDALADIKSTRSVKKFTLSKFTVGTRSPKLQAARVYDLGSDAMAFDCDVEWDSQLEFDMKVYVAGGIARLPVSVKNVRFDGVIRVILTPLIKHPPGYGAALVSFPTVPEIGLDVRVAGGELTRVPWLRSEIMSTIQKGVSEELLWPRRVVVPTTVEGSKKQFLMKKELDKLEQSDPLLRAEDALAETPMLKESIEKSKPDRRSIRKLMRVFVKDDTDSNVEVPNVSEVSDEEDEESVNGDIPELTESQKAKDYYHRNHRSSVQTGIIWERIDELIHRTKA